jgi:hypothetical protein
MDSVVEADGRLLDIVDSTWRCEELPHDDILVPPGELPDPEADNADAMTTLKEAESKWTDLALGTLSEHHQGSTS